MISYVLCVNTRRILKVVASYTASSCVDNVSFSMTLVQHYSKRYPMRYRTTLGGPSITVKPHLKRIFLKADSFPVTYKELKVTNMTDFYWQATQSPGWLLFK